MFSSIAEKITRQFETIIIGIDFIFTAMNVKKSHFL